MKEWSGRPGGTVDVHVHACTELAFARSDSRSQPAGVQPITQVRQCDTLPHISFARSVDTWFDSFLCLALDLAYLASQDPRLIIPK